MNPRVNRIIEDEFDKIEPAGRKRPFGHSGDRRRYEVWLPALAANCRVLRIDEAR
jgi:hypothetical protein